LIKYEIFYFQKLTKLRILKIFSFTAIVA